MNGNPNVLFPSTGVLISMVRSVMKMNTASERKGIFSALFKMISVLVPVIVVSPKVRATSSASVRLC